MIAGILLVTYEISRQTIGFSTREDIDFFIDWHVPTFSVSKIESNSDSEYDEYEEYEEQYGSTSAGGGSPEPPNRGKTPRGNQRQNKSFKDAVKEIERETGRELSKSQQRRLHDAISKKGLGYHEIVKRGLEMFGN